jgi:hypothetical protein
MIVAMRAVWIVQVARDDVVLVIAVRNHFVSAGRTVRMRGIVFAALMSAIAARRIRARDGEHVLIDVPRVKIMQVAVVQIVGVVVVTNGGVTASRGVRVRVCFVGLVVRHGFSCSRLSGVPSGRDLGDDRPNPRSHGRG